MVHIIFIIIVVFMVLGDLILLITGIIAVYKNDIKKIYKNEQMK